MNTDKQLTNSELEDNRCPQRGKEHALRQLSSNGISEDKLKTLIKKDARREHIDIQDIFQIIIGSLAAAIVFAPNNELTVISQNLPSHKLIIIFILTFTFVALLAYWVGGRRLHLKEMKTIAHIIPVRIVLIYAISIISCFVALWLYDIITIKTDLIDITRKVIVLLLPATWGGTLIDLLYSKHQR